MTLRLTLGADPGQTGCIAALADGRPAGFIDMPTMARRAGGQQVDAATLANNLKAMLAAHSGAYVIAVLEQVNALPKQGSASGFRFGQSDGILRGVLGALGIGIVEVAPVRWKKYMGLIGCDKDAARTKMIQQFPQIAPDLQRKKDVGRADALLLALWGEATEAVGKAA